MEPRYLGCYEAEGSSVRETWLASAIRPVYEQAVIVNGILGSLALLSLALLLWQWLAAVRFPSHQRVADRSFSPAVTLLKSLKGCDTATEDCLRSWFAQDYAGEIQILFGVASAEDPVCAVVRKLMREFPTCDAQLVVCTQLIGANAKVAKLAELQKLAKHEVLVISDADVRVPPDFLANAVQPFMHLENPLSQVAGISAENNARTTSAIDSEGRVTRVPERTSIPERASFSKDGDSCNSSLRNDVGLVNCFYRLANPATLAMQWEAIAINADFWSQVLQSKSLKPLDFALGAVMITRRKQLGEIGGFKALVDCLADDYQLGNRIARKGYRIELCPVVVECWDPPMSWRAVWKHQLRWARTIRVCQPVPYFFSILSNAGFWALLWLAAEWVTILRSASIHFESGGFDFGTAFPSSVVLAGFCLLGRLAIAYDLQRRLNRSSAHAGYFWLALFKDVLQAAIWLCAFLGNQIEWRGRRFHLRKDGTLTRI